MIEIKFNEILFNQHIEETYKSISSLIDSVNRENLTTATKNCLDYLCNNKNLKSILSANTSEIKTYISYFKKNHPDSFNDKKELNEILRNSIFEKEYINWSSRKKYGAYSFVQQLGLKTCPYCNRTIHL